MQSGLLSGLRAGARRFPRSRRSFASKAAPSAGTDAGSSTSSLAKIVGSALAASSLTYLALERPTLLLDVFSGIPEPPILDPRFGTKTDFDTAVRELVQFFGEGYQASTNPDVLLSHGFSTNTYHAPRVPAVVVWPESTEDVVRVMKLATKYKIPVTPWSGGTSLEGHIVAPYGGISIDLSRMDQVINFREADSDITVQSGMGWEDVNAYLEEQNVKLFFPLDPGPGATIGGMMATGCSGTNAVRYGTAKAEWFLQATVVLPNGEVIKTRSRARKSSAGFDTTKLFIGAEGTLGIVTEATLRLAPLLETNVAICSFPNVQKATEAVHEVLNAGVPIQCVELCDTTMMEAINQAALTDVTFPNHDTIFFKFQGTERMRAEAYNMVQSIVPKYGGNDLRNFVSQEDSKEIWRGRKVAHWSIMALKPGAKSWSTDVCVPVSKLPELVQATQEDLAQCGLTAAVLGHVGDGNFHTSILFSNEAEYHIADAAVHRMVERAIALEGTCTGEHGVGVGKKEYLVSELGQGTVDLMKTVKNAIDPLGIMNPGKLYPDEAPVEQSAGTYAA